MSKNKHIPKLMQRANIDAKSINIEERTFDVVFATEQKVYRRGWETDFYEVLVCDSSSIRAERLNAGVIPVVDTHNTWTIKGQYGTVLSWKIEAKRCIATIKFTRNADAESIWQNIVDGITKSISVGYRTWKMMAMPLAEGEKIPTYRAVDWEPMELSLVPVPADFNSIVRSAETENEVEIIENQNSNIRMENNANPENGNTPQAQGPAPIPATQQRSAEPTPQAAAPAAPTASAQQRSAEPTPQPAAEPTTPSNEGQRTVEAEMQRCLDIQNAGRLANLDQTFIETLIKRGLSVESSSHEILKEMAKNNPLNNTRNAAITSDKQAENTREAMVLGLMHRAVPGIVDLSKNDRAQNYRYSSLLDLARTCLEISGQKHEGISPSEIIKRAVSSTDYPLLLGTTAERFLRTYYSTYVPDWKPFARQVNASDFREKTGVKIDGSVTFKELSEGGEYEETKIIQYESAKLKLKTYARKFSITRQAMINDDLEAFSRIPEIIALGANQFQSEKVWGLIKNNVKAPDGKALFHADHGNLAAGGGNVGAPDENLLSKGRVAMRRQKTLAGNKLSVPPKFLIVPAELETISQKLVSTVLAGVTGDVNTFAGKLTPIVSDALDSATEWYLAGDPGASGTDGLVYSYLSGQEGLYTETQTNFNNDSVETKARLDFDASVWGWQTWYKNPGQ